jgi:plasmid stabilization system protein ParE
MNHFQVNFTDKAEYDLAYIFAYIAEDSVKNAENFVDKLFTTITNTLSLMPFSGVLFGERNGHKVHTFVVHKSYTAFYVVREDKK